MASVRGTGRSFGEALRDALKKAGAEEPRTSYTAKSARAQYKHLMKTEAGRQALADAGLTAASQTRRRWLGGRQNPGKANAAKIHAAYEVMANGQIPRAVKAGKMRITGRIGTGPDVRDRGTRGHAALEVNLRNGDWSRIERGWARRDQVSDHDLEEIASQDLIEPDIGGSDWWYFPGSEYTVELDY